MKIKKIIIIIIFIMVIIIGALILHPKKQAPSDVLEPTTKAPSSYSLDVPFTSQAPTGNWDELHNEACEEAGAIMANAYFSGDTREKIPAEEVEKEIDKLTQWEQSHFGYHLNTTALETAEMIRSVYGLKADVVNNFTDNEIKEAIFANKVVIIPVNGRKISNPNYRQPGPIYHMLVIRGYKATKVITNDSGTRNGENYTYLFSTIQNATADWDHNIDTIDESKSIMIVVSK